MSCVVPGGADAVAPDGDRNRTEREAIGDVAVEIAGTIGIDRPRRDAVFLINQADVVIIFGNAEQRQALKPVAGGRHLAVDDREVSDHARTVETLRKEIVEELPAHFDALDLGRTQIAGRRDHILQPVDRPDLGPVDDPVRDVAIEADHRNIVAAAEIIFERRIEAVGLLRPQVGIAARPRILDRVDVGDDIAETGVELAKARPRKRLRIIEARLETAAELDARAGVGQKVGVAGRTLDQHDARRARRRIGHPARARNLTVGAGQAGADHAVDRDRIGQREFITRLQEAGIAFFLRVIVARRVEPRRVGRNAV